jgi:tetratricopeptide (TPR) repeat protein
MPGEGGCWRGPAIGQEAEIEYRLVLDKFPNDVDVLTGLADVLLWQQKYSEALAVLEKARSAAPQRPGSAGAACPGAFCCSVSAEARAQFQSCV